MKSTKQDLITSMRWLKYNFLSIFQKFMPKRQLTEHFQSMVKSLNFPPFKNKNQLTHIYISRNANHPTLHYVLMELNSITLTPPKDYISFVNGDRISKHLSVPYDRGLSYSMLNNL